MLRKSCSNCKRPFCPHPMKNCYSVFQLLGYSRPVTCQIFIGSDQGKVRPHGFYQACRVAGRNSTPSMERDIDGTSVIEVELHPSENMAARYGRTMGENAVPVLTTSASGSVLKAMCELSASMFC